MKIGIIGASGQLGSEFLSRRGEVDFVLWSHRELEILSRYAVEKRIAETDADVIVNMAAFHDTNAAEEDPARAFAVNAVGAHYVAKACVEHGKKLVYASTDYVFGQQEDRQSPYVESDCTAPVNVYGVTKVAGEQLVRSTCRDHLIIRTSNLFGAGGKGWTFPEMVVHHARAGEPLKVISDQIMSPTYARDLVTKTLELLQHGATGTFHVSNAGECSWHEYAVKVLELMRIEHPAIPLKGVEFPSKARKPKYSVLASERLPAVGLKPMRLWQEALEAYVRDILPE